MNTRQIVLAGAAAMLLTVGNVWAGASDMGCLMSDGKANGCFSQEVAPEIDAASGVSAIVLLTGVLLLVGERSRSRRT